MKKILVLALLSIGMMAGAQEKKERTEKAQAQDMRHRLTPEERTDLHVKRMTLDLDLTEKQQNDVRGILLDEEKNRELKMEEFKKVREAGEKPSKEEMLKMKNDQLDRQIALKAKMKTILTKEQYEKWQVNMDNRKDEMMERRGEMKGRRGKMEAPKAEPIEIKK